MYMSIHIHIYFTPSQMRTRSPGWNKREHTHTQGKRGPQDAKSSTADQDTAPPTDSGKSDYKIRLFSDLRGRTYIHTKPCIQNLRMRRQAV